MIRMEADIYLFVFRGSRGRAVWLHVEADDDGLRCGGEVDIRFADRADAG